MDRQKQNENSGLKLVAKWLWHILNFKHMIQENVLFLLNVLSTEAVLPPINTTLHEMANLKHRCYFRLHPLVNV